MDRDRVLLGLVWPASDTVKRLATAMYQTQAMRTREGRQLVLDFVQKHQMAFDPPRSNTGLDDVIGFINACGNDDESFDLLLEAIWVRTDDNDPDLFRLEKLVNGLLPRAALTKDELRDLLALKPHEIAKGHLGSGIRRARPGRIAREGRDIEPENVREAALFLLDGPPAEEGLCRLLRFVDWLAEMAPLTCGSPGASKATQLRDWINRVADRHGLTVTAWRTPAGPAQGGNPALLIELDPAMGDRFAVYLWLWEPGSGARPLEWDQDSCRLDELRERLDELLEQASRELGQAAGRLRVEFLLDLEILNKDVDRWPFGADQGLERPLGAEYEVTVRRQRTRAQEQRNWQIRWQALTRAAMPVDELVVWIRDAATLSLQRLWAQLRDDTKILVAPLGTCEKLDGDMRTFLLLALTQGMPVALCVRRAPSDAARHLDSLKTALANAHLADLPELVRTLREQAFLEGGGHIGHDLILLWDDYDRRLPDSRGKLAAPAMKGAGQ